MENKYIVIDTWNGSGYSYLNGAEMKLFSNIDDANEYAKYMANMENGADIETMRATDGVILHMYTHDDCDSGTYQVQAYKKDTYAILIDCNVNGAYQMNEDEYIKHITAISTHKSYSVEHVDTEDNGDTYIGEFEDSDYQYRLIKNI